MSVRTKVRPKAEVDLQVMTRLEAIAVAFMAVAKRLGASGHNLSLIARGLAFNLIETVVIQAVDDDGYVIGELECTIDLDRHAIEIDGQDEITLNGNRPIAEQVSRALGKLLNGVRREWDADGAVERRILVRFASDISDDEDRLAQARRLLGVSTHTSDWGDYEPEEVGTLRPGSMGETGYTLRGRRPKGF